MNQTTNPNTITEAELWQLLNAPAPEEPVAKRTPKLRKPIDSLLSGGKLVAGGAANVLKMLPKTQMKTYSRGVVN